MDFDVTQKGHKLKEEFAYGIAIFDDDYGIVYDCKNRENFKPVSGDIRAIEKYLDDEQKILGGKNSLALLSLNLLVMCTNKFSIFP